jgi:hypothetical protein
VALGGWLPAACRDICVVPDGFARAVQEHGLQSGAKKAYRSSVATKLIGTYKACHQKSIRGQHFRFLPFSETGLLSGFFIKKKPPRKTASMASSEA